LAPVTTTTLPVKSPTDSFSSTTPRGYRTQK
jgi:hypothetical protein